MSSDRFADLRFEDFRRLAADDSLTQYERIGFPDSYREGYEEAIFADIRHKLANLERPRSRVLDIGPGCSQLPRMLIDLCRDRGHQLTLVDSPEMLARLPSDGFMEKVAALYPECPEVVDRHRGAIDVILCYSVLHYIFVDTSLFRFLDTSMQLLAPGGQMLIGDIPNVSKRKRFFSSAAGADCHRDFTGRDEAPEVVFNRVEAGRIDDAVVMGVLNRARLAGFDAYVLPQAAGLPMANRREDILIVRP
jgi:2-polyprenyl-3-methyl-5-hydroxy-6-metoxy-1,4-benzoquinol methylase